MITQRDRPLANGHLKGDGILQIIIWRGRTLANGHPEAAAARGGIGDSSSWMKIAFSCVKSVSEHHNIRPKGKGSLLFEKYLLYLVIARFFCWATFQTFPLVFPIKLTVEIPCQRRTFVTKNEHFLKLFFYISSVSWYRTMVRRSRSRGTKSGPSRSGIMWV